MTGYRVGLHPSYVSHVEHNRSDPQYKSGWDDSFARQKGSYEATARSLHR